MLVKCVRAFGMAVPGDVAEVPDGAAVDPYHWVPLEPEPDPEPDAAPETPPEPPALSAPAVFPLTPTEM